ncbi:MAG: histidinol-phosphatase HisJ family protein [Oscillospiraceae bacterium]|nr:histidinol-phosphatase HisJ family protein [Oscillospiraceae bacterium]
MYIDAHLHSCFSGDSETPPEKQIEKAISLGMKRMCFTDHHDPCVESDVDFELDYSSYFSKMQELKEKYAKFIEIGIGVELGLQPHIGELLKNITSKYPFDFVIGSIHFVDGYDPYYPEYFHIYKQKAYRTYFQTTLESIKAAPCFDSLGHLDYIARYGGPFGLTYSYDEYADSIDPILREVIDGGRALECNTGGLSRGLSDPNPCFDALRRYKELGGELITLGSDAHDPSTLGYRFDEVGERLRAIGFTHYAVYKGRKPEMMSL